MSEQAKKEMLVQIVLHMVVIDAQNTEGDYYLLKSFINGLDINDHYSDAELTGILNAVWKFYFETCTDGAVVTVRENDEH